VKGKPPHIAEIHVLLCWTSGGKQYELIGEGGFLLLRIFSFRDGLVMLCLEECGQNYLECPAAGFFGSIMSGKVLSFVKP